MGDCLEMMQFPFQIRRGAGKLDDKGNRQPMSVKAGDRGLIGKYSGTDIKLQDEDHTILREDEILAIIQKKKSK